MKIKNRSIIKLSNERDYLVDDIKEIDGKEVALLQDLETGFYIFALEKDNGLVMIDDEQLQKALAKEFDKIDKKN